MKKITTLYSAMIGMMLSTTLFAEDNACNLGGEYENYTQISETYDATRKPIGLSIILSELSTLSTPLNQQIILDGGCGSGNYTAALYKNFGLICGLDFNEGMLSKARPKIKDASNVFFKQGSLLDLPYDPDLFHGMLVNQVLHHLETPETIERYDNVRKMVREAHRVLVNGGLLIMNISTHEQWRDGFWFYCLLPTALEAFLKKHIALPKLEDILIEEGFSIKSLITPVDEVLQSKSYFNPRGPLDKVYRDGDSTWALATPAEVESALQTLRDMDAQGTLQAFFEQRDALRQRIGQTMFVVARNKK